MKLTHIADAIEEIKQGKMVVIVDDEDRENEGDLFVPGEIVTQEQVNFMIRFGRGLMCVPMKKTRAQKLELPLMVSDNCELTRCQFTVSVDAAKLEDAGISARDRTTTISVLTSETSNAQDLVRPGHVFPLIANEKLFEGRRGHTEAAVVLSELAGFAPVGVICEVIADDGSMARSEVLEAFAKKYGLNVVSIADLVSYVADI